MAKTVVRLRNEILEQEQIKHDLSDTELASSIGVSVTQIWRVKLPINDTRHNSPGNGFIAGVLNAFGGPFEKYFFLDKAVRVRNIKG